MYYTKVRMADNEVPWTGQYLLCLTRINTFVHPMHMAHPKHIS